MPKGREKKSAETLKRCLDEDKNIQRFKAKYGLEIEMDVKILHDVTFTLNDENQLVWVMGFAEVDVCVFKKHQQFSQFIRDVKSNKSKNSNIYFRYRVSKKVDEINIPFVVFELKSGNRVVVDAIRARNISTENIKEKFPFCLPILIVENTKKWFETVHRYGKAFAHIFIYRRKLARKEGLNKTITEFVVSHLKKLEKENFFSSF